MYRSCNVATDDMLKMLKFRIDGQPVPKARPIVTRRGGFTPQRTAAWETKVGWACRQVMGPREPFDGDLDIRLIFSRKGTRRADLDNLVKSILDGMNGIVFVDDRQITHLTAVVVYDASTPGVDVQIRNGDRDEQVY